MDTRPLRMLSGAEIVDRGRNVTDCILPEVGTKEVTPNGSWLETKQIQTALEARKALVAVERIDKIGALSHAEWRDQLRLAEVTQQVGGYWQYLGHNVNGSLFLLPEEALFLIETNCLLLKHNEITVSLQKAYSLLLDDTMTLTQYKVYASLSRVGYKVFRHNSLKSKEIGKIDTNGNKNIKVFESIPKQPHNANISSEKHTMSKNPPPDGNIAMMQFKMSQTLLQLHDNNSIMGFEMSGNPIVPSNYTALNKKPEISENTTLPSNDNTLNKDPEMLKNPTPPSNDNILNMEIEILENPTPSLNDTILNMDIELLENPILPSNDKTPNKEPEMSENPTLPSNDTTLNNEPEMSENPTLTSNDKTANQEPKTTENPILPSSNKTLNKVPEISENPTLPSNDTTLNMDIEMTENPTLPSNDTTLNKLPEMSVNPNITSGNRLNKESTYPQSSMTVANNNGNISSDKENFQISNTGFVPVFAKDVLSIDEHGVIRLVTEEVPSDKEMETVTSSDLHTVKTDEFRNKNTDPNEPRHRLNIYQVMKEKIKDRKIKHSDPKHSQEIFKNIPDCFNTQIITVNVPNEDYLPRNVFLNNTSYVLNLKNIKSKRRKSTPPTVENRAMYRTIRNSSESETAAVPTPELPQYLPTMPLYQQPFGYYPPWRPRFQPFNQRPHFPRHNFNRHPYFYRMMHFMPQTFNANRPYMGPNYQNNQNQQNQRKRPRHNAKDGHLQAIKSFVNRLRDFAIPPNNSLNSLSGLVSRYNEIYNEKIMIAPNFEIINASQENVETIELDDDEVEPKKPLLDSAKFDKYLEKVKALAAKLKSLERKNQPVAKQKRAFNNLLKNFNETFNAEFQLGSKGTLIDKKLVVLDSSSDSDVVATDDMGTKKKRSYDGDCTENRSKKRKVINPFNVLKTVNEGAGTSQSVENRVPDIPVEIDSGYLSKYISKNWLPNEEDFGIPVLCPKTDSRYLMSDSQDFYDFISWVDLNTWVDLKLSFCMQMEAVTGLEQDLNRHARDNEDSSRLKPILSHDSSEEWPTSLEKLRIINIDTEVQDTNLRIDFDVYNRDVQNFRKTDPPRPHFRVVCVDESSKFPSVAQVRAIHTRSGDNVTIVFAVVGVGSITYIQMNPKDLPVYLGNDCMAYSA